MVRGAVDYSRGGRMFSCAADGAFFYRGGEPHCIHDPAGTGEYFWATFDGDNVGNWLQQQGCGAEPRVPGPCPAALFEELRLHVSESSLQAEIQAAELGLRLLIRFASGAAESAGHDAPADELLCQRMDRLMLEHFTDANFGIEQVAAQLGCHRATLFRAYRKHRGLPPSSFLQRLRIQRGLELLRSLNSPIAEIAPACGFRDANYFSKVIRRAIDQSPRAFRHEVISDLKSTGLIAAETPSHGGGAAG